MLAGQCRPEISVALFVAGQDFLTDPRKDVDLQSSREVIVQHPFARQGRQETAGPNLRNDLRGILHDATKLLCEALEEHHKDDNRWSPELVDYFFLYPDKAADTLKVLESEDCRDGYYDKPGF